MPIDTETKRRSVLGLGLPPFVILPVPDGTISAADRIHIAGYYAGIAIAAAVTAIDNDGLLLGVY